MEVINRSHTIPADEFTKAYCFVLSEVRDGEWATHMMTDDDGAKAHGHYFRDLEEARKDLDQRVFDDIVFRRGL